MFKKPERVTENLEELAETQEVVEEVNVQDDEPMPYKGKAQRQDRRTKDTPVESAPQTEPDDQTPSTDEKHDWKKRYSDLQSYKDKKVKELTEKIALLEQKVTDASKVNGVLPKSKEEVAAWMEKYPDVAGIVKAIVAEEAESRTSNLSEEISRLKEREYQLAVREAEAELRKLHPDFDELRESSDFHNWVAEQDQEIQDWVYENATDAKKCSRAIALYKAEKGLSTKKKPKEDTTDAARAVTKAKSTAEKSDDPTAQWSESKVQKLKNGEYERYEEEIQKAIRSGRFVYDISGGAR